MPAPKSLLQTDDEGATRCWWCGNDTLYVNYHDREWGQPVADDQRLFEKICLEGFQSGLSWLTILRKRDNFRRAFADFDFDKIARFNRRSVQRLLADAGIVRNRAKIEATINNARCAAEMVDQRGSLAGFLWQFEPQRAGAAADGPCVSQTDESRAMSKELKQQGWSFVGPTTCYAFMQAMGIVNDHVSGCDTRNTVETARRKFRRPAS